MYGKGESQTGHDIQAAGLPEAVRGVPGQQVHAVLPGSRHGATLCQGIRPCRKLPRQVWPRLSHMHTSVTGHSFFQPFWSVSGFSAPPRSAPPRHSRIADRRACVHCIAVLEALARTSATGYDAQDPQSKKVRRKQRPLRGADAARSASGRRIAAAIPSQQTANTQGRKKSVSVVGGGTLAGRTV